MISLILLTVDYSGCQRVAREGEASSHKEAVSRVDLEDETQQNGQYDAAGQLQVSSIHCHIPHLQGEGETTSHHYQKGVCQVNSF